jgi:membrane-bound ClpP family serine protease
MSMDIRFPIGFMFTITGLIITVWGLISSPEIYKKSLNVNINLWTGLAMLVFGLIFLLMSIAAQAKSKKQEEKK